MSLKRSLYLDPSQNLTCSLELNLSAYLNLSEVSSARWLGHLAQTAFHLMPYIEGVPQCLLNVIVLASTVAILRKKSGSDNSRPSFVFIANLAVSDIILCFADVIVSLVQWQGNFDFDSSDRRSQCMWQLTLWVFCFCSNLLSTILITIDRYIYITQGIQYLTLMTRRRILYLLSLSWLTALAIGGAIYFMQFDRTGSECLCIFTHLVPTIYAAFFLTVIMLIFICVYVLYGIILVKFYKQRKQLERARKDSGTIRLDGSGSRTSPPSIVEVSTTHSASANNHDRHQHHKKCFHHHHKIIHQQARPDHPPHTSSSSSVLKERPMLLRTLRRIGSFIRAAQYVLVLVVAFSVTWLPCVCVIYADIIMDSQIDLAYYSQCSHLLDPTDPFLNLDLNLEQIQLNFVQAIVKASNNSSVLVPNLPCQRMPNEATLCALANRALHSYKQHYRQNIVVFIGTLHSILNPIIYAFCYPQFREQGRSLLRSVFGSKDSAKNRSNFDLSVTRRNRIV